MNGKYFRKLHMETVSIYNIPFMKLTFDFETKFAKNCMNYKILNK